MKDCCKEKIIDIVNKMNKLTNKTKQLQDVLNKTNIVGPDEYIVKMKRR